MSSEVVVTERAAGGPGASGTRGPERRRDKLAQYLLAATLAAFVGFGVSGCNTNPHAADVPPPPTTSEQPAAGGVPSNESSHHKQKPGIQLPNTIQVFYDTTPVFQDLTHHVVLWNASQAYKAQFAAAYEPVSAATPDLKRYWTGAGYTEAHAWAQTWIDTKKQPVGFVVLSNVTVENLTPTQATVGFCQDLSNVVSGNVATHTPGKALQEKNANGDQVVFTLVPTGSEGKWQVSSETIVKGSPMCPPSAEKHHSRTHK